MMKKLAITSVSLIRTSKERRIVFATLTALNKLGVPVILVDGGSSEDDKKKNSFLFPCEVARN